jgi:hypothetical protein
VDTLGWLRVVIVTAANVSDREGLMQLLTTYFSDGVKRRRKLWVEAGYRGTSILRLGTRLEKDAQDRSGGLRPNGSWISGCGQAPGR